MTRMSKQAERRAISPRKHRKPTQKKTGPKQDNLPNGYKLHENAFQGNAQIFIPKIK